VAQATGKRVKGELKRAITPAEQAVAATLVGKRAAIILGQYAQQHPDFAVLLSIAQEIGRITGASVGVLPDGANAVGAWLVGAVPANGLDARAMVASPRAGYLVAGVEAELDMGAQALAAIAQSEFSVVLSAYRNATTERAHVMLPIVPFTETPGTFVNMEGRAQTFNAVVKPQGEARPGWKVLRMLGSLLQLPGFEAERIEEVRAAIAPDLGKLAEGRLTNAVAELDWEVQSAPQSLERIEEFAIYAMEPVARRSRPLQLTRDMKLARSARLNPATAAAAGLAEGDRLRVRQGGGEALLNVAFDAAVPEGCVRIARGIAETAALGEGALQVEKIAMAAVA
ncbi:MAG TPA: molybdopterin-dependent oxidoreductase, partial [Usitatibacter sp.]|nr:molybdopterin-dependent oxidoreductase [Usitatibacter sp.]